MSTLEIKPVETNRLFFGKYKYSARFDITELGIIRGLDVTKIDRLASERSSWRRQHKRLYSFDNKDWQITADTVSKLKHVCNLLEPHKEQIKFVVSYDRGYVYTNNVELVKEIGSIEFVGSFQAQEAVQVCPEGSIALKNPTWTHRTYFKSKSVTDQQRDTLIEYLESRENVRVSPGLKDWMKIKQSMFWKSWIQAHYFIDHNNDGELLFLNMVIPRITGRTLTIVAK